MTSGNDERPVFFLILSSSFFWGGLFINRLHNHFAVVVFLSLSFAVFPLSLIFTSSHLDSLVQFYSFSFSFIPYHHPFVLVFLALLALLAFLVLSLVIIILLYLSCNGFLPLLSYPFCCVFSFLFLLYYPPPPLTLVVLMLLFFLSFRSTPSSRLCSAVLVSF